MKQFLIAIDQAFNVMLGSGWADETISAYLWRSKSKFWMRAVNTLFFDSKHCQSSYESEQGRMQLPPEYRVFK